MSEATSGTRSFFVFGLGDRWFAIDTEFVEMVAANDLPRTAVPTAPSHIEGVVNHRGRALAIFDLARFLGCQSADDPLKRLVVVAAGGMSAAVPFRESRGIVAVDVEALRPADDAMRYSLNVVDLKVGAVQVLDLPGLLSAAAVQHR